jgi:hypothetical protein
MSSILSTSATATLSLVLFQLLSRGTTFFLNQTLLRFLSPETLGLAAQLDLFSITVLYFARESIRVACQREPKRTQSVVNLSYLSIIFGVLLAFGLGRAYLNFEELGGNGTGGVRGFELSLLVYAIGCIVELLAEPAFVVAQQRLLFGVRARAEGVGTVARCVATCAAAFWGYRKGIALGVLPFALGQLAFSFAVLAIYTWSMYPVASQDKFSLFLLS